MGLLYEGKGMKIKTKLFLSVLGLSVMLLISNILSYRNARRVLTEEIISHLDSVATLQKHHLTSVIKHSFERLRIVASRTQMRISLRQFLKDGQKRHQEKIRTILLDALKSSQDFIRMDILSSDGITIASTSNAMSGIPSVFKDEASFIIGRTNEHLSGFQYNQTNSQGYYFISGPLYYENEFLGVLIIQTSMEDIISTVQDYAGLGQSGETVLAGRNLEGDLMFLTSKRFESQSIYGKTLSWENTNLSIVLAFQGEKQFLINAKDYRGTPVIAVTHFIPNPGWGVVVKIDKSEAFAPLQTLRFTLFIIVLVCVSIVLIGALFLIRSITDPINHLTVVAREITQGEKLVFTDIPTRDEFGILARAFNTMTDRLTTSNDGLLKAKQEWEKTFEAIGEIALIMDKDLKIIRSNPEAGRILTMNNKTLQGKYCYEAFSHGTKPCENCPVVASMKDHKVHTAEMEQKKLGKIFEGTSSPVLSEKGQLEGFVYFARDITRQKALEEQLRQSQKIEAVGTLAGGIAHDINNILAPILGYAEIIRDTVPADSQTYQDIQQIINASSRAKDLVQQILSFSRHSKKTGQIIQLQEVIKEALNLLRSTIPANITINQKITQHCGPVWADPSQIHQIIINLGTNAHHAMRSQGGVLSVNLSEIRHVPSVDLINLEPGRYALLTISDTGKGMEKEVLERVFDPFFTTKEKGQGTGLGLYVVHSIVTSLKGRITIESEPGKGTTIYIYLPITNTEKVKSTEIAGTSDPKGTEHIMIVDDFLDLVKVHKRILEKLGYQVTGYTDSLEALRAFQSEPDNYDLVISDVTMPGMTGDLLAQAILEIRPGIPIILCTGFSDVLDEARAKEIGVSDFIQKPVSQHKLSMVVRKLLDSNLNNR